MNKAELKRENTRLKARLEEARRVETSLRETIDSQKDWIVRCNEIINLARDEIERLKEFEPKNDKNP